MESVFIHERKNILSKLSGVITAIPTPLHENENVDVEGLRNVIEYVIEEEA